MDTLGGRTMRDTKAYWQDIHDQAENVIYKSHGDSGWLWMFELSQRMLNKCAQKKSRSGNYRKYRTEHIQLYLKFITEGGEVKWI